MELENENSQELEETKNVLGQFTFHKDASNQRVRRSASERMAKTKAYEKICEEKEEIFGFEESENEKKSSSKKSKQRITPGSTMEDDEMLPPKSGTKG